jgi:hypothetical protein
MGKLIEVFVDGSENGDEIVKKVNEYACPKCVVTIYDASNADGSEEVQAKASAYGLASIPAVTIDGKPIDHNKLRSGKIGKFIQHLKGV